MIQWSNELYLDEKIKKKPEKWKKRVERGSFNMGLYCICLASNPQNLFDIINSNELLFQYYKRNQIYITGLAGSREEAVFLLQDMVEDIYRKTGDVNVRKYFTFSSGKRK